MVAEIISETLVVRNGSGVQLRCEEASAILRLSGLHGSGVAGDSVQGGRHEHHGNRGSHGVYLLCYRIGLQEALPEGRRSQRSGAEGMGGGELPGQSYPARHIRERRGSSGTQETTRADHARDGYSERWEYGA